jgi:hypothetical protein
MTSAFCEAYISLFPRMKAALESSASVHITSDLIKFRVGYNDTLICRRDLQWHSFSYENLAAHQIRLHAKQIRLSCHFGHAFHRFDIPELVYVAERKCSFLFTLSKNGIDYRKTSLVSFFCNFMYDGLSVDVWIKRNGTNTSPLSLPCC